VFLVQRRDPDLLKELARVKLVLVRSGLLMLLQYHDLDYYAWAAIRDAAGTAVVASCMFAILCVFLRR
jgi:hypothetical protein